MTNAVLVGVDGSENSLTALRWGARFATLTDRPLVLAYAWQHGRRLEGAFSSAHTDAPSLEETIVSQLRALAAREGCASGASYRPLRGPVAESFVAEANRSAAAIIVVGVSGTGGARRALLGSVSRTLTTYPSHVVAVVPGDAKEVAATVPRLVVGVDGSDGASRAVHWAADTAAAAGGDVVGVHAFECPVAGASYEEAASLSDERGQRLEVEWCAPLRAAAVPYRASVENGDPRHVLRWAAEAEQPICVVVGSRGLGAISQRVLGSVTYDLVRHLASPTIIVPSARDRVVWPPRTG